MQIWPPESAYGILRQVSKCKYLYILFIYLFFCFDEESKVTVTFSSDLHDNFIFCFFCFNLCRPVVVRLFEMISGVLTCVLRGPMHSSAFYSHPGIK